MAVLVVSCTNEEKELFEKFAEALGYNTTSKAIKEVMFEKIARTPQNELRPRKDTRVSRLMEKLGAN